MDARALFVQRMEEAAEAVRRELAAAGAGDLVRDSITVIESGHGVKVSFFVAPIQHVPAVEIISKTRRGKVNGAAE